MSTEITPTAHLHLHINLNDVTAIFSFNYFKMGKLSYTSDSLSFLAWEFLAFPI